MQQQYFATEELYSEAALQAFNNKKTQYLNYCDSKGLTEVWGKSMKNYYGISSDGTKQSSQITRGGDSGQYTMVMTNDYRNLIQHQLTLITQSRPAGVAKAINSDPDSLKQSQLATSLVEYYMSQVGWEEKFTNCAEGALTASEGFAVLDWDASLGDPVAVDPESQEPVMSGDAVLRVIYPWNMARECYASTADDLKWYIYSYSVNKWDLAKKFPNNEQLIVNSKGEDIRPFSLSTAPDVKESDFIKINVLSHEPTPAVPQGRYAIFINDVILLDGPFPYVEMNVYRMKQSDAIESVFGYTNNYGLLALQEVKDALSSIIISNEVTFGGQSIIGPHGANIQHTELAKGFSYFEVDPNFVDKIRPLELVKTAPELFKYEEGIENKMQRIANIDPVSAGNLEGGLRSSSGSALALIQAQSIQSNSGGQKSYYNIMSKVNTGLIKLLQRYATTKKVIRISGKVNSQYIKEFKYDKDSLQNISSVIYEPIDPMAQTVGGKQVLAENLISKGMIKNIHQYLTVIRTGNLEVLVEDDEALQIAQRSENEELREGKPQSVIITENHEEHITAHRAVIAAPIDKANQQLVGLVLQHIQEHLNAWQQLSLQNPALLIATGQKVLPPPPPPPGMLMPGQPPPNIPPHSQAGGPPHNTEQGPGGQKEGNTPLSAPQKPVQQKAEQTNLPSLPTNPLTGQKAQIPGAL